jgi:K+-sensing histidine kinase KdpD
MQTLVKNNTVLLVVEDDPQAREVIELLLESQGYDILSASDGKEGIKILEKSLPDLILSDVMMPNMDGFEFYKKVQENFKWRSIPFVFMTALSAEDDIKKAKEMGVDDYVTKPIDESMLFSIIKGKLNRSKMIKDGVKNEVDKLKNEIISVLSHEFRTPLSHIIGISSILLDERENIRPDELEFLLEGIKHGGDRLSNLIEEFLIVANIEAGDIEKVSLKSEVDIKSILESIIENNKKFIAKKNIDLKLDLFQELPFIVANAKQIYEIFSQLMSNAIKFTPQDGNINLKTFTGKEKLWVEISDSGIGIPQEEIPKIFDKFYQVNRKKMEQQGAGLGLYIAKKLAEANNCKIKCNSIEGKGSNFIVEFDFTEQNI